MSGSGQVAREAQFWDEHARAHDDATLAREDEVLASEPLFRFVEGWVGRQDYIDAMAQVPAFTERLEARWWELRGTVLTEEALLAAVDAAVETTAPAIEANVALWPVDQIAFSWGGVENWLCPVDSYEEELERAWPREERLPRDRTG